jgi:hypothetical protein
MVCQPVGPSRLEFWQKVEVTEDEPDGHLSFY